MTVRELYETMLFYDEKKRNVSIALNGGTIDVDLNIDLNMVAYGDFVVSRLMAVGPDSFEIDLAVEPIRSGEARR